MPDEVGAQIPDSAEQQRVDESREKGAPWKQWVPYLSERQWGTVREDYSENGDAWNYFTHDQARLRAYHWGEDGLAGISDDHQRLCFAVALWNGRDPILKERLFGLTNSEGNHGEDVKEYYFYLDSTRTHSYMKYLYKYPQNPYPYANLVETNKRRGRNDWEYELLDTGIFNENRYFDVFVEYTKATGGNSNWRGPIWMPVNALIIRALLHYYAYYGDNFKIECPTGSGKLMNLFEVAQEITNRLTRIFLRDENRRRPVFGGAEKFQKDPYWRDNLLFYEYFHGDNGAGIGASHQTGWTGIIAALIHFFGNVDPEQWVGGRPPPVALKRERAYERPI